MEFLISIVGAIGGEIAKYTLVPLGRQIGYLLFYNGNINNLEKVFKKLNDRKTTVDLVVDAAERNLRIPAPETKTWQQNVDVLNGRVTKFLEEEIKRNNKCLNDLCPNPKSRYSLSRKATKMKQEILVLLDEAEKNSQIDLPAPPPALGPTFNTEDTKEFESRNLIMNQILEALKDDHLNMISICGQGGVGKTRMVEKLVGIVESEMFFDKVAMAVVSQNPDVKTIQGDIASCLGLKFHDENEQERAQKLHERIINVKSEEKILLILDDVWTEMDFQRLRIPLAGKRMGYKILLTSRREDECRKMGCLMNFRVGALSNEEGWNLFKGIAFAGFSIDNQRDNLHQLAKQVSDECDGLPIAIVTIAKALNGRDVSIWEDALNQLRSCNLRGISGMEKVYSGLELSYNLLQVQEAKECFLLCCLFPEDYDIRIEDLVRYAVGLRLLDNVETILQARHRVYALIVQLKESFLLLDSNKDDTKYVKMHDVVRDFAISIASREKSYLVSCDYMINHWPNKWLDRYNDCTAISLWCGVIEENPTALKCPKLRFLQIQSDKLPLVPDNFFEGMKELRVVDLHSCFLPQSLNVIKEVRTLHLSHMESTSTIGELENVEILEIRRSKGVPVGVGLMKNLRLLDLRDMHQLECIPAGVLSKLSKLEELYVNREFVKWESRVDEERMNASLMELESQNMTTLEIGVSNFSHLPKRSTLEKLVNFKIYTAPNLEESRKSGNALILSGDASEIIRSVIFVLLKKAEYLMLHKVQNLKNGIYELEYDGFPELKTLVMCDCHETEQLIDVKKIKVGCFRILRKISIISCSKLEYMFPTNMTRRMSQSLQSIRACFCENMEGIFNGKEEGDDVQFPNLAKMYLSDLPNLKALWIHKSNDHQEVKSNSMEQPYSVLFPSSWIVTSNIKVLTLIRCHSLKVVFSMSVAELLRHLHTIEIKECQQIEYIVGGQEGNTNKTLLFPMLTRVSFCDLPELVSFCVHSHIFLDWSSLERICVYSCPKIQTIIGAIPGPSKLDQKQILFKIPAELNGSLKVETLDVGECENLMHLFTSRVAKLLVKLEHVTVSGNCKMEQVIAKDDGEEEAKRIKETIEFSKLISIDLIDMENMRCFYGGTFAMEFPLLKYLDFKSCSSMKTFSYGSSIRTPKLESIRINGQNRDFVTDLNRTIKEEMLIKLWLYKVQHLVRISLHHLSNEEISEIRQIKIEECNNLLNVIPCNLIARLGKVEVLDVKFCSSVEEIFEYDGVNIGKGNVAISSNLQQLNLRFLSELKHIFSNNPTTFINFQKLKMLSVSECKRLKNIFSVSMARGLVQLEELEISACLYLEEIIAKENEEETEVTGEIILPQLSSVYVSSAYNVKCFYSGNCALELPSLRSLKINGPKMKCFSNGVVSSPQLTQVQINYDDYPHSGDLNEDIKNQKLAQVDIRSTKKLMRMLCLPTEDSKRIKYLDISNCETLLNANDLIRNAEKLERLFVHSCISVKEIFEYEETSAAVVPNLGEISLNNLPKLEHIFNKSPRSTVSFQKLWKLDISYCNNLKNILSISSVRDLVQLEELHINECKGVEQIVAKEEDEEEITNKIAFPQLRSIFIKYCSSNLKCFYNGICDIEFPLLRILAITACPQMKNFSNGSVSTPNLQDLLIDYKPYPCSGNLNVDFTRQWDESRGLEHIPLQESHDIQELSELKDG